MASASLHTKPTEHCEREVVGGSRGNCVGGSASANDWGCERQERERTKDKQTAIGSD
jgi:hypothetical protein